MNRIVQAVLASVTVTLSGCAGTETPSAADSARPVPEENHQLATSKPQLTFDAEENAMSSENMVPLFEYLYEMADALDCYFTAERMADSPTYRSPIKVAYIGPEEVTSIDALVDKVNNDVDGLTATRSGKFPKVIHLVEEALADIPGYAIEEVVTIEFSGTVDKLLLELGQLLDDRIRRVTGGGIPPDPLDALFDDETETEVDAEEEIVRDILTGAVPFEGYNRVLWSAATYLTNADHHVETTFLGPPWWEED